MNTETIEQAAEQNEAKYKALLDSHNLDLKTIGSIKRNCEKINEHTWKMYKEQILLHIESIEVANQQS